MSQSALWRKRPCTPGRRGRPGNWLAQRQGASSGSWLRARALGNEEGSLLCTHAACGHPCRLGQGPETALGFTCWTHPASVRGLEPKAFPQMNIFRPLLGGPHASCSIRLL